MKEGGERGQAAVEVALVLPLLVLLALAVAQVALVARDQVLVAHAAREAARAVAVDRRPGVAEAAARRAAPALKPAQLATETSHHGRYKDMVTVTVRYRAATAVPGLGRLVPDVELRATAAMRDETGQGRTGTSRIPRNSAGPAS